MAYQCASELQLPLNGSTTIQRGLSMFIITVLASKGGVGKTTTAANLGGLLHDIGFRTLLIDGDIQPSQRTR